MATVHIAPQMRDLTDGATMTEVDARTVRGVIEELDAKFPGLATRIRTDEGLVAGWAVSIDGVMDTRGLAAPVGENSEIHFLPAIGGG